MFGKRKTENKDYNEILENVKISFSPEYEVSRVLTNEEEKSLKIKDKEKDLELN